MHGDSINRRALLAAAIAALPLAASPARAASRRLSTLWWRGTAHVEADGRSLDLTVETSLVVPLIEVRSVSYITAQGPGTARTLILAPDGVWLERGGTRSALPPQLGIHERQQYAIYAWLLFFQQYKKAPRLARDARGAKLHMTSPPWPDVAFEIGADGFPVAAEWTVEDAEPGKPAIPQRIVFTGRTDSNGVRWPTRFTLTRHGQPYFDLTIAAFRAS